MECDEEGMKSGRPLRLWRSLMVLMMAGVILLVLYSRATPHVNYDDSHPVSRLTKLSTR
jgi:hypothetical protein